MVYFIINLVVNIVLAVTDFPAIFFSFFTLFPKTFVGKMFIVVPGSLLSGYLTYNRRLEVAEFLNINPPNSMLPDVFYSFFGLLLIALVSLGVLKIVRRFRA